MTTSFAISCAGNAARNYHAGQTRRDGKTPYINHIYRVVDLVLKTGGSESQIIAAYLHDVCEDTPTTPEDLIKAGFSEEVVAMVRVLTKHDLDTYPDFIDRVLTNKQAVLVKVCDILANLGDEPTKAQIEKYGKALAVLAPHL